MKFNGSFGSWLKQRRSPKGSRCHLTRPSPTPWLAHDRVPMTDATLINAIGTRGLSSKKNELCRSSTLCWFTELLCLNLYGLYCCALKCTSIYVR